MKKIIPSIFIIIITCLLGTVLIYNGAAKEEAYILVPSLRFPRIRLKINDEYVNFELYDNECADEFYKRVKENDSLTITLTEYGGFEEYGDLGFELPTNDITVTTLAGELAIYQSNKICLFYGSNTSSYTKIGKVVDVTEEKLKELLTGDTTLTFDVEPMYHILKEG